MQDDGWPRRECAHDDGECHDPAHQTGYDQDPYRPPHEKRYSILGGLVLLAALTFPILGVVLAVVHR